MIDLMQAVTARAPDVLEVLKNLDQSLPNIQIAIKAFAYCTAFWIVYLATLRLAKHGNGESEVGLGSIFIMFGVAILLVNLPTTLDTMSFTILKSEGSALSYSQGWGGSAASKFSDGLTVIFKIIGTIGLLAVVRGLMEWKNVSEGLVRNGYAKGTWHIIGGWMAFHLDDVIHILKASAGIH